MPMLNMTAALTNPYTLDVFDVVRRAETVNNSGLSVVPAPQTYNNVRGVVTPTGDESLKRGTDSQEQAKTLEVTTLFGLRGNTKDGAAQTWQPDIVIWRGNQYIVNDVKDYGAYAAGFVQAGCSLMDSAAVPPAMGTVFAPGAPPVPAPLYGRKQFVETPDGKNNVFTFAGPLPDVTVLAVLVNGVEQTAPKNFILINGNSQVQFVITPAKDDDVYARY